MTGLMLTVPAAHMRAWLSFTSSVIAVRVEIVRLLGFLGAQLIVNAGSPFPVPHRALRSCFLALPATAPYDGALASRVAPAGHN